MHLHDGSRLCAKVHRSRSALTEPMLMLSRLRQPELVPIVPTFQNSVDASTELPPDHAQISSAAVHRPAHKLEAGPQ